MVHNLTLFCRESGLQEKLQANIWYEANVCMVAFACACTFCSLLSLSMNIILDVYEFAYVVVYVHVHACVYIFVADALPFGRAPLLRTHSSTVFSSNIAKDARLKYLTSIPVSLISLLCPLCRLPPCFSFFLGFLASRSQK